MISGDVNSPTSFTGCQLRLGDRAYSIELNCAAFQYKEEEKNPVKKNCRARFRALVSGDLSIMHSRTESSGGQVPWLQKNAGCSLKLGYFRQRHLWHVKFYSVPVTILQM